MLERSCGQLADGEVRHYAQWGGEDEDEEAAGMHGRKGRAGGGVAKRKNNGGGSGSGGEAVAAADSDVDEEEKAARAADALERSRRMEEEKAKRFGDLVIIFRMQPRARPARLVLPSLMSEPAPLLLLGPPTREANEPSAAGEDGAGVAAGTAAGADLSASDLRLAFLSRSEAIAAERARTAQRLAAEAKAAKASFARLEALACHVMPAIQRRHAWLVGRRWPGVDVKQSRRVLWLRFGDGSEGGEGGDDAGGCASEAASLITCLSPGLHVERLTLSPSQPPMLDEDAMAIEMAVAVVLDYRRACSDGKVTGAGAGSTDGHSATAGSVNGKPGSFYPPEDDDDAAAAAISSLCAHPAIRLLKRAHVLGGLPLVAVHDACALVCGGRSGLCRLEARSLWDTVDVDAALRPPPKPIAHFSDAKYEAPPDKEVGGHGFHEAIVQRWRKVDVLARGPPLELGEPRAEALEWQALLRLCAGGASNGKPPPGGGGGGGVGSVGVDCVALLPGAVLSILKGRPLQRHNNAYACIPLERRQASLALSVERDISRLRAEWKAFDDRMYEAQAEQSNGKDMSQYIAGRRHWLFALNHIELRRWYMTGGRSFFDGNGLEVEQRLLANEARYKRLVEQQKDLIRLHAAVGAAFVAPKEQGAPEEIS